MNYLEIGGKRALETEIAHISTIRQVPSTYHHHQKEEKQDDADGDNPFAIASAL